VDGSCGAGILPAHQDAGKTCLPAASRQVPAPQAVIAYVAVGSNIEPRRNVPAAVEMLCRQVEVCGVSTFYRTPAVGPDGQPRAVRPDSRRAGDEDFLNGVLAVRTARPARELKFQVLRAIEDRLARVRSADKYAPRTIDLDVVLYGQAVIDEPDLRIPARDLDRPFVALPLLELAPDLVLPRTRQVLACLWPGGQAAAARMAMVPDEQTTALLKEICRK
jgi:2-amino-4-hydroxy-6-hydroxymethyldihydropteridine diphosphokinase